MNKEEKMSMAHIQGYTKENAKFRGYRVSFMRRGALYTRYFPANRYGSMEAALEAAKKVRDDITEELKDPFCEPRSVFNKYKEPREVEQEEKDDIIATYTVTFALPAKKSVEIRTSGKSIEDCHTKMRSEVTTFIQGRINGGVFKCAAVRLTEIDKMVPMLPDTWVIDETLTFTHIQ